MRSMPMWFHRLITKCLITPSPARRRPTGQHVGLMMLFALLLIPGHAQTQRHALHSQATTDRTPHARVAGLERVKVERGQMENVQIENNQPRHEYAAHKDAKLVLISIDGVRWQDLFYGADPQIATDSRYVKQPALIEPFLAQPRHERLMPFLHSVIARQGLLVGDRYRGSQMQVMNPWHFSYPGYNELLSGMVDNRINSNQKIANPNVTVLEWLNQQPSMQHKVAAFGSWDVLPYILNVPRSGLMVNAGFSPQQGPLNERQQFLNQLQRQTPSPWGAVRLDVFTHQFALEYLKKDQPRLLYIAYGEPDDFAHEARYDQYLQSLHRIDQFIAEIWQQLQQDPYYRDQTHLLITTDHGRGNHANTWMHHASARAMAGYSKKLAALGSAGNLGGGIVGSDEIWLAAIGPEIPAQGLLVTQTPWQQAQVASTVAQLLGFDYQQFQYNAKAALPLTSLEQQFAKHRSAAFATTANVRATSLPATSVAPSAVSITTAASISAAVVSPSPTQPTFYPTPTVSRPQR